MRLAILNSSSFGVVFPHHRARIEKFASVEYLSFPIDTSDEFLSEKLRPYDAIILSVTPALTSAVLRSLPKLRLIARHGIGCDNIDLSAAHDAGIVVSRVSAESERDTVAEHTIGLLLGLLRHIPQSAQTVLAIGEAKRVEFIGSTLRGTTVGIIGFGSIGSRTGEILHDGFGCRILAYDPLPSRSRDFATFVTLDELLLDSKIVSLHCPLSHATTQLLGEREFALLPKGAIVINTARAELIDSHAMLENLRTEHLGGYGSDLVPRDQDETSASLIHYPRALFTPHIAAYTYDTLERMGNEVVNAVEGFLLRGERPPHLAEMSS